jgi:hypothetical protein
MPYVNKPRPYKKEYAQQKARGEHADGVRLESPASNRARGGAMSRPKKGK